VLARDRLRARLRDRHPIGRESSLDEIPIGLQWFRERRAEAVDCRALLEGNEWRSRAS
jgi:hypothetical protein